MRVRIPRQTVPVVLFLLLCHAPLSAEIIRVPQDVATIQGAIDVAAAGDIVEVADGTWSGEGFHDLDYAGKAVTVRSANGPENCILEFGYNDGFIFDDGEGRGAVVEGFTIANSSSSGPGAVVIYGCSPTITGNVFFRTRGLVVTCSGSGSPLITGNTFDGCSNGPYFWGGSTAELVGNTINGTWGRGVWIIESDVLIGGNIITGSSEGGIGIEDCSPTITNNVIRGNYKYGGRGAGISMEYGSPLIANNLIEDNAAEYDGGGIYVRGSCSPVLVNNTIVGNRCGEFYNAPGICFQANWESPEIRNCIVWGNLTWDGEPEAIVIDSGDIDLQVSYSAVQGGWEGTGNIDADPLFAGGALDDFYLGQVATGQAANSPCVDAGDPADDIPEGTTRTDSAPDSGIVDMGYHHQFWTEPGMPPQTRITGGPVGEVDSGVINLVVSAEDRGDPPLPLTWSWRFDFGDWSPYGTQTIITLRDYSTGIHTFEVRARNSAGLVDPTPAVRPFMYWGRNYTYAWENKVTGPGPGDLNPTLVRTEFAEWEAYGTARYGVNVACGDLDGSAPDEIITGPGPGAVFGPHVRAFNKYGSPIPGISFLAYGTNKYGVRVAAGDVDDDGRDEIITGAGPGAVFGPHVRGWDYEGGAISAIPGISYFAYGTLKYGVNVAAGDIDGDGRDEIVTGAGPGAVFGPHVRGWRCHGGATAPMPAVSFLAYGTNKYGVNVACGDLDGDGIDEIVTGAGPGLVFGAHVRAWEYDGTISPMPGVSYFAFDSRYGVNVGTGDITGDGIEELLTAVGPDPEERARVRAWSVDGGEVYRINGSEGNFQAYDDWMTHGATVAGGNLD